jgi:hypothetical protein
VDPIEQIRKLSEFIIFGQKYNKPEYFEALMAPEVVQSLSTCLKLDKLELS